MERQTAVIAVGVLLVLIAMRQSHGIGTCPQPCRCRATFQVVDQCCRRFCNEIASRSTLPRNSQQARPPPPLPPPPTHSRFSNRSPEGRRAGVQQGGKRRPSEKNPSVWHISALVDATRRDGDSGRATSIRSRQRPMRGRMSSSAVTSTTTTSSSSDTPLTTARSLADSVAQRGRVASNAPTFADSTALLFDDKIMPLERSAELFSPFGESLDDPLQAPYDYSGRDDYDDLGINGGAGNDVVFKFRFGSFALKRWHLIGASVVGIAIATVAAGISVWLCCCGRRFANKRINGEKVVRYRQHRNSSAHRSQLLADGYRVPRRSVSSISALTPEHYPDPYEVAQREGSYGGGAFRSTRENFTFSAPAQQSHFGSDLAPAPAHRAATSSARQATRALDRSAHVVDRNEEAGTFGARGLAPPTPPPLPNGAHHMAASYH